MHQLPSVFDYWSQNPFLGTPGITKGMPRDRFLQILRYLHLNDNAKMPPRKHPQYDKLYKVRPLIEIICRNEQSSYYPHQEVAVDEAMVLFKGRSSIKQYMPLKPIKRGYKIWCLCDSRNGFAYEFRVYQGATGNTSEGSLGENVVLDLIKCIEEESHHVYTDNFFTSPSLNLALHQKQTYIIRTTRTNRKGFPRELHDKSFAKRTRRGQHKSVLIHGGQTECLVWKDKKPVHLINSMTDPAKTSVTRTATDGMKLCVPCPMSVQLYNQFMGGVDLFDFRRKTYFCSRKSKNGG